LSSPPFGRFLQLFLTIFARHRWLVIISYYFGMGFNFEPFDESIAIAIARVNLLFYHSMDAG
jgi:hypothetical protein